MSKWLLPLLPHRAINSFNWFDLKQMSYYMSHFTRKMTHLSVENESFICGKMTHLICGKWLIYLWKNDSFNLEKWLMYLWKNESYIWGIAVARSEDIWSWNSQDHLEPMLLLCGGESRGSLSAEWALSGPAMRRQSCWVSDPVAAVWRSGDVVSRTVWRRIRGGVVVQMLTHVGFMHPADARGAFRQKLPFSATKLVTDSYLMSR